MTSTTPSSDFGHSGVLDDRLVTFTYKPEGGDYDLRWYDTTDRNCRGIIFREDIIVVIPANDAEDGYYILSMVSGEEKPKYHKESGFAYGLREQYASGLPLPFLQRYPMYQLPKHLFCLWTRKNSSIFHVIVSQVDSSRAREFAQAIVLPTLDAIGLPGELCSVSEITPNRPLGELIANTIRPLARKGISQTILLVAGDQTLAELINALAIEEYGNLTYIAPVIGVLALGQNNTFAYSLERATSSTSLGLNAFLKGEPELLPLMRVSLSDGWSWLADGAQQTEVAPKTVHALSSVSFGPASCIGQRDKNKNGTQADAPVIPHAYRNKLIVRKSDREDEVIEGDQHYCASAEIPAENTTASPHLSFSYNSLRPGANFQEFSSSERENGEHLDSNSSRHEDIESLRVEFHGTKDSDPERSISIDGRIIHCSREEGWLEIVCLPLGGGNIRVVTHIGVYECPAIQEVEYEL